MVFPGMPLPLASPAVIHVSRCHGSLMHGCLLAVFSLPHECDIHNTNAPARAATPATAHCWWPVANGAAAPLELAPAADSLVVAELSAVAEMLDAADEPISDTKLLSVDAAALEADGFAVDDPADAASLDDSPPEPVSPCRLVISTCQRVSRK